MTPLVRSFTLKWGERRRLRFTPEGWVFTFITVSMGLVAVNTGHNLFYLVFGLLLSLVIVSGVLSESVLRHIEIRRRLPPEVTARIPFAVMVEVRNASRKRYSFSLTINDGGGSFSRRDLGYLPHLVPGKSKTFHTLMQVEKRGTHRFEAVHLVTRFPFGLFEKTRLVHVHDDFVAYPPYRESARPAALFAGMEEIGMKKSRWGEEILSLRPALPEDDYRSIHWRTSARMGSLVAKEFTEETGQPRLLFFDHRGSEGPSFERAVETAAGLLRWLASQRIPVTFFTWKESFDLSAGSEEIKRALRHLALIAPMEGADQEGYQKWQRMALRDGVGLFLRGDAPPPSPLPPCQVIFL